MRPIVATLALLPLLACAPVAPGPTASLPPGATQGAGDPLRGAVLTTAYIFNNQASLANPASAARAVANIEYLAVNLAQDPSLGRMSDGGFQLAAARTELRGAIGITPDAPPQLVIDALYAAASALAAQDMAAAAAALPVAAFPDSRASVVRLTALPSLPASAQAASAAQQLIRNQDVQRDREIGAGSPHL